MSFLQTSLNGYLEICIHNVTCLKLQNYIILCKAGGKNPLQLDLYVSQAFC